MARFIKTVFLLGSSSSGLLVKGGRLEEGDIFSDRVGVADEAFAWGGFGESHRVEGEELLGTRHVVQPLDALDVVCCQGPEEPGHARDRGQGMGGND